MTAGERIKQARKKAGLTQKELGMKLNVSQAAIGQFENKKADLKVSTLHKIAEALSVPIADLMDLEDFKRKPILPVYHFHKIFEHLANKPYGYSENEKREMAMKINDYIKELENIEDYESQIIYHNNIIPVLTHEILTHLLTPYSDKNVEDIAELIAFYLQLNWDTRGLVIKMMENLYGNEKLRIKIEN